MNLGTFQRVTIVNTIHTGAAFGVLYETGENCYIPASVAGGCRAGDEYDALLVQNPNTDALHRTPYMVRFIKREAPQPATYAPTPAPAPEPAKPAFDKDDVEKHVRMVMKEGGVWTVLTMFQDYMNDDEAAREDNVQAYNAISTILRKMHADDECAKWSLWTKGSQSKPGREWFSCYPQNVEVAEWEDA